MGTNRLEELREARGYPRTKIATVCGVGEAQVRRWESGEVLVPTRYLPTLCELFDTDTEHLMGWDTTRTTGAAA